MGSLASSILSETYLQFLEHTKLTDILIKHQILGYFRYVDDILIVFNNLSTDIKKGLNEFNIASAPLSFTMEKAKDKHINFLDISISNQKGTPEYASYRKPTTTDSIIPFDPNHAPNIKWLVFDFYSIDYTLTPYQTLKRKKKEI
jgi:hypothetical protein